MCSEDISSDKIILLLYEALKIQPFQIKCGPTIEQALEKKSDEEIRQMLFDLTGEKPAKKWVGIEKEDRRKFYSKVKKNLNLYHLGQSTVYDSIFELIKSLIQRDYPKLDTFDGSEILQIYIPEIWLNQCPRILGKIEYQELRKALKKYDEKVMDKYDDLSINFKGNIGH